MPGGLPEGLVTSTEAIQGDIESVDRVAIEDIQQLWKVYSTNKNLIANDVGKRLENFFWRIWGNGRIQASIRGSQVAILFHRISEGDVIRTTPTPSPRATRFLPILPPDTSQDGLSPEENFRPTTAIRDVDLPQDSSGIESPRLHDAFAASAIAEVSTTPSEIRRRRESAKLPPILKKSRAGSSIQFPKTARILTPTWKSGNRDQRHDDELSSSSSTSTESDEGSDEGLEMHTTSLLTHDDGSSDDERSATIQALRSSSRTASASSKGDTKPSTRTVKKKSAFVASTTTIKRRPSVGRRKSSQSSSSNASKTASPRLTGQEKANSSSSPLQPNFSSSGRRDSSQLARSRSSNNNLPNIPEKYLGPSASTQARSKPSSSRPSRSASPVSSSQKTFQQPSLGELAPKTNVETSEPSLQDWLVDRDFRSKFVDRSRNASQATSPSMQMSYMPTTGTRSSVVPQSLTKGKGKVTQADYTDEIIPLKPPCESSSAIASDDEDPPTLPRTKSQLTTLLQNEKDMRTINKGKARMLEPKPDKSSSTFTADDDDEEAPSPPMTRTKKQLAFAVENERKRDTESKDKKGGKIRKKHSR
ncbi:hypothetical protein MMC14_003821 [Varicellaria rhodocarpa]|nr:hypothetical protein [Varicellaria rhodocarpa]